MSDDVSKKVVVLLCGRRTRFFLFWKPDLMLTLWAPNFMTFYSIEYAIFSGGGNGFLKGRFIYLSPVIGGDR